MWYDKHIARYEGVQGGQPVVAGTRTPVRTIAVLYETTYPLDLDEVHASLPHLAREQIVAALMYYDDHRPEIDGYIAENEELYQLHLLGLPFHQSMSSARSG